MLFGIARDNNQRNGFHGGRIEEMAFLVKPFPLS
jgi:hypothetical protein